MRTPPPLLAVLSCFFLLPHLGEAQDFFEHQKVIGDNIVAGDFFGLSVATSETLVVSGAPAVESSKGAVYIFALVDGAWQEVAELQPDDLSPGDEFGYSVAVFENQVLVGALEGGDGSMDSGAAYLFELQDGSWVQVAKFLPEDGNNNDQFGFSVALGDDLVAIGARNHNSFQGAVYLFEKVQDEWLPTNKLEGIASPASLFGNTLALSGDRLLIGSNGYINSTGIAYLFKKTAGDWTLVTTLEASNGGEGDGFGFSVALDEDIALVGAKLVDNYAGRAYVFEKIGEEWLETAILAGADIHPDSNFGYSVGLSGSTAVIGAPGDHDNGPKSGAFYVFEKSNDGWEEVEKHLPTDGQQADRFGRAIAYTGDYVLVGAAWNDDLPGPDCGSAYVFAPVPVLLPELVLSIDIFPLPCETQLSFDTLTEEGSDTLIVSLYNAGPGWLQIDTSSFLTGGDTAAFEIFDLVSDSLAPGQSVDLTILFAPTGPGVYQTALQLVTNDPLISTCTIPLVGVQEEPVLVATETHRPIALNAFPNPASQALWVNMGEGGLSAGELFLLGYQGETYLRTPYRGGLQEVILKDIPGGIYALVLLQDGIVKAAARVVIVQD